MKLHDGNDLLERSFELERYKMKLWDKYLSVCSERKIKTPFEIIWYDFLLMFFVCDLPIESYYEKKCKEIEIGYGT